MKKRILAVLLLTALVLTGCRSREEPPVPPPPEEPVTTGPLALESLAVEFAGEVGVEVLPALNRLPEKLRSALAAYDVEIEEIRVTLAASQDAAARAVSQGTVDLSFLSAEAWVQAESGGVPLLADAEDDQPGRASLLCIGPSPYGQSLSGRKEPTWEELSRAHWGVLEESNGPGNRFVSLWLADHYEGNTLSDLPQVTVCDSYESLLRAAAAEEVDVFASTEATLDIMAEAWCLELSRSDDRGYQGFGRSRALTEEIHRLGTPERYCSRLAVLREDETLNGRQFTDALSLALDALAEDEDWLRLAGASRFAPLAEDSLDALRRCITLEG